MLQRQTRIPEDPVIRPLLRTSRAYYILAGILLIPVLWFLYAWYTQLTQGLIVTDMRTPVGAAWGIYISSFVYFACMAHGGMAISAAVRLFNLNQYRVIARMGEVLTAVAILMAGMCIVIDMGRPERVINMILYWPERVLFSPLTWDMTVIILYFTMSTSYVWLTMRKDLLKYAGRFSIRGTLYRSLLHGYSPDHEPEINRTAKWIAVAVLVLIVMLSGGVIPWIFGLQSGRPGWFGAMAGPYFLTAALATSIAAVILIASILRKIYGWQSLIKVEIFRGLGIVLGVLTHIYIYLTIAEQFTMRYAASHAEAAVSEILLQGEFAPVYWVMLVAGLAIPALALIGQSIKKQWFSLKITVISSVVILVAFWVKRFLIVVPSLLRQIMPFPTGTYFPSWVEWSAIAGIFALAVLLYMVFIKVFPIMESEEE
ncbi:NrfD/PsrC family molybdoenzyme membrane anchor subunit [Chloroflexota bacterium]